MIDYFLLTGAKHFHMEISIAKPKREEERRKREKKRRTVGSIAPNTATTPPKLSPKIIETLIATIPDERELSSAW